MLANTELYLLHGWGYDSSVWTPWLSAIKADVTPYIYDRGYFKTNKQNFSFNISGSFKIVIAHSLGLHYLSASDFNQIHMLVLIGSFQNFHECSANYKLSKKQIAIMQKQLLTEPKQLLQDFYSNCDMKHSALNHPLMSTQLLSDDLWLLDNVQINIDLLKPIKQVLLLHGSNDTIVDIEHSKLLNKQLPNSKMFIHRKAGHALPFSNRLWCLNTIQSQLDTKILIEPATLTKVASQ